MASTKISKKEGEKKKKKKNAKESPGKTRKTPIKRTPSKLPKKQEDKKNNSNKTPSGKVKESPEDSIISFSSSDSLQEVQEAVTKKELAKNSKPKNQSSNNRSPKIEKSKKRKIKEDDIGESENGTMCSFPMARIKRIIKTEDIGSKLTQDVVFLVNKATEMFLEQFCEEAYECAVREENESLAYKHLSSVVSGQRRFDFLSDFVPKQLKAKEALRRRTLVETVQRQEQYLSR
ncbi:DNA polymerase epsilon subunit, putative [Ricinus communis]|uniref:DNA polymerase epsilon subunit, putative n=2 Tax=Ricinus communis TaxID=3988 RepID=B9T2Z4_RICCO|nr:DNA polymerase epsilon subunit, putative [Ricinus communis]